MLSAVIQNRLPDGRFFRLIFVLTQELAGEKVFLGEFCTKTVIAVIKIWGSKQNSDYRESPVRWGL